jgi:hypothetical protein
MDARAPAVVAVVVTRDPGPWFDETLAGLANQHYEELSVLVLVAGGDVDPTARVAAIVPEAFVRRLPEPVGFAAAANEVIGMVEGAAFFLFCQDDCALTGGALQVMVEESYRSNAGIVTPKFVRWDDPGVLVHVGMSADKTGAVVDRVQSGEVDHGQHDAVRDVFVAPTGCSLVRADLFAELGGFDAAMVAMGEDLDLSWRAQIAGARVVVAPDARVRSLQVSAGELGTVVSVLAPTLTLQELQRRHELRAVLKCYGPFHLVRVVPQALLLAVAEVVAALIAGDRARAQAVVGAWRWNLGRLGELRRLRRDVRAHRVLHDAEVRRLQLRGSARLVTYFSRLSHEGFAVAHGRSPSVAEGAIPAPAEEADLEFEPALTGSVGGVFSEDADFDELDDLGRRAGRDRFGRRRRRRVLVSPRSRLVTWLVVALVLTFGTRDLFAGGLPLIGQFLPLGTWTGVWHHFVAGWQPAGVGTTAPATPAFAVLGVVGTILAGAMGLVQKVLVLGCIPLGAYGVARLLGPLASPRARLVGAICYLGLPLPYDDLAQGRWDGLVAYAAVPFVLSRLARASGLPPFGAVSEQPPGWRRLLIGHAVALGALEAVAMSFAPAMAAVVPLCALGVVVGSLVVGEWRGSLRVLGVGAAATAIAVVLCGPWAVGTLAGGNALAVFGLAPNAASAPSLGGLLRFALGPLGGSPLDWLPLFAALLPLLIARHWRLTWAARLWSVGVCSWVLAWLVSRHWAGSFAPSMAVVLAPAAVAVAAGVGLGVSAFESDLSGYRFGWRQIVTAAAVLAAVLGVLPVAADSFDGRWGLVSTGYADQLSFMNSSAAQAPFRVLWLGAPRALPTGGWSIEPGLAYATSEDGTPDASNIWTPAGPGPAQHIAQALSAAMTQRTNELGRLLAPAGVRYVVVVADLAPVVQGVQTPASFPVPPQLTSALLEQNDLREVPEGEGITVFSNADFVPQRAARSTGRVVPWGWPRAADLTGWLPVLTGTSGAQAFEGAVPKGTVLSLSAPAGRWSLSVDGIDEPRSPAFGWAAQFAVSRAGAARLSFAGIPWLALGLCAQVALWLALVLALLFRRRIARALRKDGSSLADPGRPEDLEPAPVLGQTPTADDSVASSGGIR